MTASISWQWGDIDASGDGGDTCLSHRHSDARLDVRGGRLVRGAGYAAAPSAVRRELARVGAIVRLRQLGRYLLHAAGVVDPMGRGWLLAGDSGNGKSTLAYALARTGWAVLGDDGVMLEPRAANIIAHAWHEPLRVSRDLATDFPELRGDLPVAVANDARHRVPMVMQSARSAPVRAIVLVERAPAFSIGRAGPVEALGALVRQSPWVILEDEYARPHLELLRKTAALPVFRLGHTAAELHRLPDVLLGAAD